MLGYGPTLGATLAIVRKVRTVFWVLVGTVLLVRRGMRKRVLCNLRSSTFDLQSQSSIYTSRRPSMALCMVTSSAYSRSLPTGTPIAMRVTRTPSGLSSLAR